MITKKILALFLAMILSVSLVTCGGGNADAPAKEEGNNEASDNAEETGTVEEDPLDAEPSVKAGSKGIIEYWTVFTGADGTSMQEIVDSYNATNPDYTVNHRAVEANDLYLKMPLAIQSGEGVPDVCINHIERIPAFVENGFLVDYTDYLPNSPVAAENYNEKAWKMSQIDGGHYGIPLDVHTYVLYVNMDLYEEYGAGELDDNVLTWDEVKEVGKRLEGTDIIPMGLAWLRVKFLASYAQLGGTLSTDGETPDFNNEKAAQVLQNWIDLYEAGYTHKDGDAPWEMFLGGKMLFCPEGIWMYNNVMEAELNAKMYDYPVFDANVKGNWTSSHQFVLPKSDARDDEKTQAILQFIDYVGNNALPWAKAGQVPANNAIKESAEFQEMPQAFLADENEELKIYDYKYYGYAVESLDKVLAEVLFGRMDIETALKQAVQETKDRIETEG